MSGRKRMRRAGAAWLGLPATRKDEVLALVSHQTALYFVVQSDWGSRKGIP